MRDSAASARHATAAALALLAVGSGCAAPGSETDWQALPDRRVCALAQPAPPAAAQWTPEQAGPQQRALAERQRRALTDQRCDELLATPAPAGGFIMRGSRSGT